jgi:nicotinamidase-related amidase
MGDIKAPPGAGSIHLCVDMQNLFAADGPWPTPWMEKVLPTIVRLAEHAPERTVFTRFIPPACRTCHAGVCTLKLIPDHGTLGEFESFHAHTHSVSIVKPSIGAKIGTIAIVSRCRVLKLEGKCP